MNFNSDGAEIDDVKHMEVYGDWLKFTDGEGATVKIAAYVLKKLMMFALENATEFNEGSWNEGL